MKFDFKLKEKARTNLFYIEVLYEGGDADTEHYRTYGVKDSKGEQPIDYYTYTDPANIVEIQNKLKDLELLRTILEINSKYFLSDYNEVEKIHGKKIATYFESVPDDPQNDYQDKCYLDSISIIVYDDKGDRYEHYIG